MSPNTCFLHTVKMNRKKKGRNEGGKVVGKEEGRRNRYIEKERGERERRERKRKEGMKVEVEFKVIFSYIMNLESAWVA